METTKFDICRSRKNFSDAIARADFSVREIDGGMIAYILESKLNGYENPYKLGMEVGETLQQAHRTLQGLSWGFILGFLAGLCKGITHIDRQTDPRNHTAIKMAARITQMDNDGELERQMFI